MYAHTYTRTTPVSLTQLEACSRQTPVDGRSNLEEEIEKPLVLGSETLSMLGLSEQSEEAKLLFM